MPAPSSPSASLQSYFWLDARRPEWCLELWPRPSELSTENSVGVAKTVPLPADARDSSGWARA